VSVSRGTCYTESLHCQHILWQLPISLTWWKASEVAYGNRSEKNMQILLGSSCTFCTAKARVLSFESQYVMSQYMQCGRKVMRQVFFKPWILFFLQIEVIRFKIVPLGSYTATEALFPLFVAVLEGFCWIPFSSSVTLFWILSKVLKWCPFKWFLSLGNKKKSQGLRSGE